MSDLIDRQELYHEMTVKSMELFESGLAWHEFRRGFDFAMEFVQEAPSTEPERKKGHWIEDETGYGYWICSRCGFVTEASAANILYHFCPNCGTRMEIRNNE